ncbi:hypothetical protein PASE110613_12520 [Paenibacillus sediminis]|uniref:Uncharacterized protein n=1 Tax=Paenibacillus sediminis TaxID=664909 RepID=A0ABS4H548_9BACL|nr:hypothetical protein [Paenibacillus sediminis]MBP1937650.1 hypothetical protein [Paenibacillus sediminis]
MDEIKEQLQKMMSDLEKMMKINGTEIMKSNIDPMDNIEYAVEVINGRKKLVVKIDLDEALGTINPLTNKGNSYLVATTGGFHEVVGEFHGLLMSLNVTYDKKAYEQRQLGTFQTRLDELSAKIATTNKMIETISSKQSEQQSSKTPNSQPKAKVKSSKKPTKLKPSWKNKSSKRTMRCRSCYYFNTQNFCAVNSKTMEPNDSCDKHRGVRPTIYNGGRVSGK